MGASAVNNGYSRRIQNKAHATNLGIILTNMAVTLENELAIYHYIEGSFCQPFLKTERDRKWG